MCPYSFLGRWLTLCQNYAVVSYATTADYSAGAAHGVTYAKSNLFSRQIETFYDIPIFWSLTYNHVTRQDNLSLSDLFNISKICLLKISKEIHTPLQWSTKHLYIKLHPKQFILLCSRISKKSVTFTVELMLKLDYRYMGDRALDMILGLCSSTS